MVAHHTAHQLEITVSRGITSVYPGRKISPTRVSFEGTVSLSGNTRVYGICRLRPLPFPSVNSSASPRLGSGGRLEAGKRLYALPDILALRASNLISPGPLPGENLPIGNPVPGFLPIKEAGTVGPLPHAFNRQRANAWFAGSTEYSIDVKVQVRLPMVCVLSLSDSGLSLSRHLRPLAAHARGMCLIHSLYCAGGPCLTLARIPLICSS